MKLLGWLRDAFVQPDWEKVLTPRAKQVLALSRRAASEHGWKQVEVEHLLAGILRLNQGVAVAMLKSANLETSDLRASLEQLGTAGTSSIDALKMPCGPAIKPCLLLARKEAKELGNNYCGTEHLLLGILRCEGRKAHEVLRARGLTLERARSHPRGRGQAKAFLNKAAEKQVS